MLTKTLIAASVIALGLSACNKAEETPPNSTPSPAATSPAPAGGSSSTTTPAPATPVRRRLPARAARPRSNLRRVGGSARPGLFRPKDHGCYPWFRL